MKEKLAQIKFRIEPDVLEKLERIAKQDGCTINQKIEQILKSCVLNFKNER